VAASHIWSQAFSDCGDWAVTASIYAVVIFMAALVAGRTLNRQASQIGQAQRERDAAEVESVRAAAARVERQRWFGPAVDSCVPLLRAIGDGSLDPAAEDVRRRCRQESGYLRGLVSASAAPAGVRDGVWSLLHGAHEHGLEITVRGDLSRLPAPPADLAAVLPDDLFTGLGRATTMEITGVAEDTTGSLMVNVSGAGAPLPVPPTGPVPPGMEVVIDDDVDGLWLEVSWQAPGAERPVALSSGATSTRTPVRSAASP